MNPKGDWGALVFHNGSSATLDYAILRYGGFGYVACSYGCNPRTGWLATIHAADNISNVNLLIRHSLIEQSQNAGINASGSAIALTVTDSTIRNNGVPNAGSIYYQPQGIYYNSSIAPVSIFS